jgi:UDP-N-acetylglucosamine 4,6-dehydratase/5-epimerase
MFDNSTVLITGGTGSFGKKITEYLLGNHRLRRLIIFSRDEMKQYEMSQALGYEKHPAIRYFIGDVRDRDRLDRAFSGVDYVIHGAAMKHVPAAEYNPIEAIKTNIVGAANIIDAAIDQGVKRVIALSTDKAANPVNLYGATKLCSDKLFIAGNHYGGGDGTRFSIVRYGNVVGSRGSVIPYFLRLRETGVLPITDPRMTRFWITLDQGVAFVLSSLERMQGGEIFVPRIPSMNILDLAKAIAPECRMDIVGVRPGEKLHETMIPEDEARYTLEYRDHFVILPAFHGWDKEGYKSRNGGNWCDSDFKYASDTNDLWLSTDELHRMVAEFNPDVTADALRL